MNSLFFKAQRGGASVHDHTQSCVLESWLHLSCVHLCHKIVLHVLKNLKSKIPLKCGWLSLGTGEGGVFQRAATVLTVPALAKVYNEWETHLGGLPLVSTGGAVSLMR